MESHGFMQGDPERSPRRTYGVRIIPDFKTGDLIVTIGPR
jgi:hypothetical protein